MPEPASKLDAQREADRAREFRGYLAQLERDQVLVLSEEQRQRVGRHIDETLAALATRFDVDVTESQRQISLGMRVISALGALALCIAVFLFFYRIWGLITTPVQVAVLAAVPIVALIATEFAAERERTLYFASLLALLALAGFVLNLTVLGTIFNITPSHRAFLVWGAFALILAYRYRLRLMLTGGLLSLLAFLSASIISWSGCNWLSFGQRPENFIPAGLILLAIPLTASGNRASEFASTYRAMGLLAVFIPVLILGESGHWTYLPLATKVVEHLYQVAGFIAAALAIWYGITLRYREVLNLGSAFFAIFLICRFVDWWWDWMPKYLFFFMVGAIALGLLAAFRRLRSRIGPTA
jgi:uncharacterized membrane protein